MDATSDSVADRTYGEIVIVGGGCYGSYYVRQLTRAAAAGAISWTRLTVVDRDPSCAVATGPVEGSAVHALAQPSIVISDWSAFFDTWISRIDNGGRDAIVPSPLMPHLFFEYLARRVKTRFPARTVERADAGAPIGTPWERTSPDRTVYVSHATWICPTNCVEPHVCPHTRGIRDWTMPASLASWTDARRAAGENILGPFTFQCTHRAYGVGMVDRQPILDAEQSILDATSSGSVRALVATASHCHGAAAVLSIS